MLKYITKNEYEVMLSTQSVPDNFNNLVVQASNYINYKTRGRIGNNQYEQVKYVTCLLINLINNKELKKSEIGNLKSQNIEGWSETYQTPEEIEAKFEEEANQLINQYLWDVIADDGKPLLFKGVLLCE